MITSARSLITIDSLAEELGTSTRHVRRLVAERRIPYIKVGRLVRFDPAEIQAWIDARRKAERVSPAGSSRRIIGSRGDNPALPRA